MIFTAASVLALAVSALAQTAGFDAISKPTKDEKLTAGGSYAITWEPSSTYTGTVSIALLGGATPQTLQVLSTISSGVTNSVGSYSWSVGSDLGNLATYGIRISLDSDTSVFQYSYPFQITASEAGEVTSTTSSSSTTTGTSTASSALLSATSSVSPTVSSTIETVSITSTTSTICSSASAASSTSVMNNAHAYNSTASAATTLATAVATSSNHTKTVAASTGFANGSKTTASSATATVVQSGAASNVASLLVSIVGGLVVAFFFL